MHGDDSELMILEQCDELRLLKKGRARKLRDMIMVILAMHSRTFCDDYSLLNYKGKHSKFSLSYTWPIIDSSCVSAWALISSINCVPWFWDGILPFGCHSWILILKKRNLEGLADDLTAFTFLIILFLLPQLQNNLVRRERLCERKELFADDMAQIRLQSASFQTILAQELEVEMEFGEIKLLMSIVAIFKIWKWLVERQRQLSSLIFLNVGKTGYDRQSRRAQPCRFTPWKLVLPWYSCPKLLWFPSSRPSQPYNPCTLCGVETFTKFNKGRDWQQRSTKRLSRCIHVMVGKFIQNYSPLIADLLPNPEYTVAQTWNFLKSLRLRHF